MTHAYDDIIHLPHPEPKRHPRMSLEARAAQFAPFAALTGHQAVLAEAARYTEQNPGLDDQQCAELNRRVNLLLDRLEEHPMVVLTLFEKDGRKNGGRYREVRGIVAKFDEFERVFTLGDGQQVALSAVVSIDLQLLKDGDPPVR